MRNRLVISVLYLTLGCASGAQAAVVEAMRSYRAPEYTRLVFDLDHSLDHRVFTLENPDRVVIDLVATEVRGTFATLVLEGTPIAGVRSAPRNGNDTRVVLDMSAKVQPRSFLLGRNEQYGERLVIDLYDDANARVETSTPPITAAALLETKRDIVIAISAGHGGDDPGAIGVNRLREKNVVLAIAREVEKLVNASPGYRAVMIRDGDYYVGLRQQMAIAHEHNADLFIAIHADAHSNSSASGSTVYALSQRGATSEQAHLLAEKENASDLIGGVGSVSLTDKDQVLASVLLDLSMTASIATSLEIGDQVIRSLSDVIRMRRKNVEQAAFVVLKSADIPSLLIESGYITNANDAKNLDSQIWRQRFAGALVHGITTWFHERPPVGSWVAWQKANGDFIPASHTVQRGDSLSEIAERYGLSVAAIKAANGLGGNTIRIGQVLSLPLAGSAPLYREHTIVRGETLSGIAESYSVPMASIRETNQLTSDTIRVGQILKIPTS